MLNTTPSFKLIEGGKKLNEKEIFAEINRVKLLLRCFIDISSAGIDKMNFIETQLRGQNEN
ncbi:hypothetical protein ACLSZY_03205 [Avibacterium volantium]|uniref:hypothetical protein n=1 Tax=Avibacterium TaxID=292486 RepID=UPI0039FBCB69